MTKRQLRVILRDPNTKATVIDLGLMLLTMVFLIAALSVSVD